ncbi:hypothetical protein NW759_006056 [Fusarium solani]|nr:hypothetical protein NW759_006056 [Fusarium solani]
MHEFHGRDWPQRVHMITWYCDREHDRLKFKSESKLQKHLNHDHTSLSEAYVNALVRRNWGFGCREAHVCPLCESTPSNIVPLMNDKDKATLLFRHIGDHLKALALFSLPSLSTDPANDEQKSSSGAQLPTNDDSEAHSAGNNQAVAGLDEDLEGSLTFDDDPNSLRDAVGSEETIKEGHISDVPSDLDATLEWKFASSKREAPELDPILETLRIWREEEKPTTNSTEQLKSVSLSRLIHTKSVMSAFDTSGCFFPNGSLDNLITKESVTRELWVESSSKTPHKAEVESLAKFISISAKKLFGILVFLPGFTSTQLIRQRMEVFRDKSITDSNLPLQESWWEENFSTVTISDRKIIGMHNRNVPGYEELWTFSLVKDFCTFQHWFLAPVFSSTGLSYDLEPGAILPFTERDPDVGHSAWNIRYRIHEKHIDQQTIVKSAFRQMAGLTSAIDRVHSDPKLPYLPHGDLKPEHIYVFSNANGNDFGTLKIGAGELWSAIRSTIDQVAYVTEGCWWYEAPELNNSGLFFKQPPPRACDIWSMGCIMLEFLIWLMYGVDGLHRFIQAKQSATFPQGKYFYQETREGQDGMPVVTVEPVVLKWMDHMAGDPACEVGKTALGNLLELIRTRLLVVKPPHEPRLAPNTASSQVSVRPPSSVAGQSYQTWERCTSGELEERMQEILDENETERYWLAAEPKSPPEIQDRRATSRTPDPL